MTRVGIAGGAGYTAGELCRILLNHPEAEIRFVNSSSQGAGTRIADVHEGLYGETDLAFTDEFPFEEADVLFLCLGHGKSAEFLRTHEVPSRMKIIDLAQDFRLPAPGNDFVYGLPELNGAAIAGARHVANPGCFATCIQLGLLPLAAHGLLGGDVTVNAVTGSTGAGAKPGAATHFSWRNDNISIYKAFSHQHVPEIVQSLRALQPDFGGAVDFIPWRGGFSRGIFATEVIRVDGEHEAGYFAGLYRDYYREAAFTHYADRPVDLKQVVNTNKALVHVDEFGGKLLVTAAIDNLLKGASGQAVQNMNLMCGLDEACGLHLKPSAF